jgi:ketosteroid isomerase-like protein
MSDQINVAADVEVVQEIYAAFGRGDIPVLLNLMSEEVEWVYPGPSLIPFAGTHHGSEGIADFLSSVVETLDIEQFEPHEFVAQDDTVVVLGYERSHVKATDRTFEQEWAHVYTLRDGKVVKVRLIENTAALAAAFEGA